MRLLIISNMKEICNKTVQGWFDGSSCTYPFKNVIVLIEWLPFLMIHEGCCSPSHHACVPSWRKEDGWKEEKPPQNPS